MVAGSNPARPAISIEELMLDTRYKIYVYPDNEIYEQPPSWKSDDYETRDTALCLECDEELRVEYAKPFASCACGTQ